MLDFGLWTVETLHIAEIRLSVTTVMSQQNFPSLRVHNEANAQRDDTMYDVCMCHCEQMIVDRGSVPAYIDSWEVYCEYMRSIGGPAHRPWEEILFALGTTAAKDQCLKNLSKRCYRQQQAETKTILSRHRYPGRGHRVLGAVH